MRRAAGVVALAVIAGVLTSAAPVEAANPPVRPPVLDGDWADPEIVRDPSNGRWYTFATNFTVFGVEFNVPARSSSDLANWSTFEGDALPTLPAWASRGRTWAPGVARIGSQWVLFFTARHTATDRQCIGAATSATPDGPYTPIGTQPVVCQVDRGGSIDASPFLDPATNTWWLHWKSDENAPGVVDPVPRLWAAPLTPDLQGVVGTPIEILRSAAPSEPVIVEAPEMVAVGGRYWLFYSSGSWSSSEYRIHWAQCNGPGGPCSRLVSATTPMLGTGSDVIAPGGQALAQIDASRWAMVFQGWRGGGGYEAGGWRAMHLEPVTFDGTGGRPRLRTDLYRTLFPSVPEGAEAPAVFGAGNSRFEAWRGGDRAAWLRSGSTAPASVGGILSTGPDVTLTPGGTMGLVGIGSDGAIWFRTASLGWRSLGGGSAHAPAIESWGEGRFDVFITGLDRQLWHIWSGNGGQSWSGWEGLGGQLTSAPDVASGAPGTLEGVGRGMDGAVWRFGWSNGWAPWQGLGGGVVGAPSIAVPSATSVIVAIRGLDDAVWTRRRTEAAWSGWSSLGGRTNDRPGIGGEAGAASIVVRGVDGKRWRTDQAAGSSTFGGWMLSA